MGGLGRGYAQCSIVVSLHETVFYCIVASFPGPAQLFVACSAEKRTNSDGKLGGACERGYCIVLYVPLSLHQSIACLSPESSGLDIGVSEPPTKLVDACWLNTGRLNSAAKSRDCAN